MRKHLDMELRRQMQLLLSFPAVVLRVDILSLFFMWCHKNRFLAKICRGGTGMQNHGIRYESDDCIHHVEIPD